MTRIQNHHAYVIVTGVVEIDSPKLRNYIAEAFGVHIVANEYTAADPDFFHEKFETLTIDDSRRIREIHSSKSFSADVPRMFIIEMYAATREAQNALLKIVEEPQAGTFFFFVVPSMEVLIPTLQSRVHVLEIDAKKTAGDSVGVESKKAGDFLRMTLAEKIAFVDALAADVGDGKKAKHEAVAFVNAVERTLYDSWVKNRRNADDAVAIFKAIARARDYMNDRAPSVKMLLEYVALSV